MEILVKSPVEIYSDKETPSIAYTPNPNIRIVKQTPENPCESESQPIQILDRWYFHKQH